MCDFCRQIRLQPDRFIKVQGYGESCPMVETKSGRVPVYRSLEFRKRTGLRNGIYPGLGGITVRYNEYMAHVIDKSKKVETPLIEVWNGIPGMAGKELNKKQSENTVPEMDQDHVLICWWPDWHPTSAYVLEHLRWTDKGYKKLRLTDQAPETS